MKRILLLALIICGFQIGFSQTYDREWATYFGDSSLEITGTIYTRGNIFIVGKASGESPNIQQVINEQSFQSNFGGGNSDGFIAKFSTEGQLIWFTYYGGAGDDRITNITTDGDKIYVIGQTSSGEMGTANVHQVSINGTSDGFIASFDENGNLIWHSYFGGENTDRIDSVTYHGNNLYLYGTTKSYNNIATIGAFQETIAMDGTTEDYTNNFVAKFSNTGQRIWATYYGVVSVATIKNRISGISINESGLYVAGWDVGGALSTNNTYFGTVGAFLEVRPGNASSLYLSKFSFDGNRLWSTYFSGYNNAGNPVSIFPVFDGSQMNVSKNVFANANGVYMSGFALGTDGIATTGSFQPTKTQLSTLFVTHFSDTGERLWGSYLGNSSGGINYPQNSYLSSDVIGNIYISGGTGNISDISTTDGYQSQKNGEGDLYVAKISADGTSKIYGTYYGGNDNEKRGHTIPIGDGSVFYLIGMSGSSGLATNGAFQEEVLGSESLLISKFIVENLSVQDYNKNKLVLYPNPVQNNLFIDTQETQYQIHSVLGVKVSEGQLYSDTSIDCSGLTSGIYFISLTDGLGKSTTMKFVKE